MALPAPVIAELLGRELNAARDVESALGDEHAALAARDATALLSAVARKSAAMDTAARLRQERPAGLLDAARGDPLLAELEASLRRCRTRNDENGALIRAQRKRVSAALDLLTGVPGNRGTYGPDGAAADGRRGRHALGTA
jgi:flagellar biosynthesis/type III secretory pathway chaperone